jgi:hypothetical protein
MALLALVLELMEFRSVPELLQEKRLVLMEQARFHLFLQIDYIF